MDYSTTLLDVFLTICLVAVVVIPTVLLVITWKTIRKVIDFLTFKPRRTRR